MSVPVKIEDIKRIELSILDYINELCKQNNINYYLSYGTLLGAVRHGGFIPWDDDIDICMLREDYEKFIQIASKDANEFYRVLSINNDSKYYHEFAKVVDSRTRIELKDIICNEKEGIWVDIFPIDPVANCRRLQKIIVNTCLMFRLLSVYKSFPNNHSKLLYPFWIIAKTIGFKPFLTIIDKISKSGRSRKYVGYIASYGSNKYYFEKEMFDESTRISFEGLLLPVPKNYDIYLTYLYGDYMTLPPENQRISNHSSVAYWR